MQISLGRRPIAARAGGPGRGIRDAASRASSRRGRPGLLQAALQSYLLDLLLFLRGRSRQAGPARGAGGGLPRAEAEVRRGVGAAASAGARAGPRLCSVLHASGARPAPEQQQPGASPQRQPPEPPPERGRGAPRVAATARRHLPGLDRPELLQGDEPQRALDAGAVLAQALLEPRQAQSLQPNLGSALRLRHGELRPPCPPPTLPSWPLPPAAPTGPTGVTGSAGRQRG